ncbi:MAG: DUF1573 domain-containing protein [Planctomycetota bacterium]|nr:MAG: DUF1573 domain-containing protein [Planctomycetota bacterium]REJ96866.1 MAG: DUF1573 domain-containing protein [Planctomycetota bacterium]
MRLSLIAILAVMAGLVLGTASTNSEFGYQSLLPWDAFRPPTTKTMFYDGFSATTETVGPKAEKVQLTPPPEDQPQPKARVEADTLDFGIVEAGDGGVLTYVIHNDGEAPLVLKTGDSSCKCTVSKISKEQVPPGESSEIVVEYRTKVAKEKYRHGFSIKTNDRERPLLRFSLTGKVLPVLSFEPRNVSALLLTKGEPHAAEVRLLYFRDTDLEIIDWRLNNRRTAKYFEVSTEPLREDELSDTDAKSGFRFRIRVKPGLPVGDNRQELTVRTNKDRRDPARVAIFLRVHEAVSVFGTRVRSGWDWSTQSLTLKPEADGTASAERLVVQAMGEHRHETQYEVKEVVPAELDVSFGERQEQKGGKAIWTYLNVALPQEFDAGAAFAELPNRRGHVVLATTNPAQPEVRFEVSYLGGPPPRPRPIVEPSKAAEDTAEDTAAGETSVETLEEPKVEKPDVEEPPVKDTDEPLDDSIKD